MPDETEDQIKLVCILSWPARSQAGTFQMTVGRTINSETQYRMPAFPASLLRDADLFKEFCDRHLSTLRARLSEPWDFRIEIECDNAAICETIGHVGAMYRFGPYAPSQLDNAHLELREGADAHWTFYIQTSLHNDYETFHYTRMSLGALRGIYKWFWEAKDLALYDLGDADEHLRKVHEKLAYERLREGDDESAAEHSKIAFDLSPTDEIANGVRAAFTPVVGRWSSVAVKKENAVQRRATAAREGNAEHATLLTEQYYHDEWIEPLTTATKNLLESGVYEERRQNIRACDTTNPYRQGLELIEKVEANMGPVVASLAGTLTEWPLEELRKRVTSSDIAHFDKGWPWFPDTRLQRLASMTVEDIPPFLFSTEVMSYMNTLSAHLDRDLPGILTYAFSRVPDYGDAV